MPGGSRADACGQWRAAFCSAARCCPAQPRPAPSPASRWSSATTPYLRVPPLRNAVNDAAAISDELRKFGFQVIRVLDGKASEIAEAKRRFISAVGNGGIGVFYFSGHGIQLEGRNYLLPVDFSTASPAGLARDGISVPNVLDEIERAKPRLNIVILDACRDNPFSRPQPPRSRRPGDCPRSLARCPRARWSLYAASSNQTALDGIPNQRTMNGLFTGELLAALREPRLEVRDLAQRVRYAVMEKAQTIGHLQVPALYDNLSPGAFYFADPRGPGAGAGASCRRGAAATDQDRHTGRGPAARPTPLSGPWPPCWRRH